MHQPDNFFFWLAAGQLLTEKLRLRTLSRKPASGCFTIDVVPHDRASPLNQASPCGCEWPTTNLSNTTEVLPPSAYGVLLILKKALYAETESASDLVGRSACAGGSPCRQFLPTLFAVRSSCKENRQRETPPAAGYFAESIGEPPDVLPIG